MNVPIVILTYSLVFILISCQSNVQNSDTGRGEKAYFKSIETLEISYQAQNTTIKESIEEAKVISQKSLKFDLSQQGSEVLLYWSLKKNSQTKAFILEHSQDGKLFQELALLEDNLKGIFKQYSYTDIFPSTGLSYYRLRQLYRDGTDALSATLSIEIPQVNQTKMKCFVVENPKKIEVKFNPELVQLPVQLELLSELGIPIYRQTCSTFSTIIPLPNLMESYYTIKATSSNQQSFFNKVRMN